MTKKINDIIVSSICILCQLATVNMLACLTELTGCSHCHWEYGSKLASSLAVLSVSIFMCCFPVFAVLFRFSNSLSHYLINFIVTLSLL